RTPQYTASPACSPTWPPSAPTRSNPPTTCPHSPCPPAPLHYSGEPSNSSTSPTATAWRSQYNRPTTAQNPSSTPQPVTTPGELRARRRSALHRRDGRREQVPRPLRVDRRYGRIRQHQRVGRDDHQEGAEAGDVVVELAGAWLTVDGRLQHSMGAHRMDAVDLRRLDDLDETAHPRPGERDLLAVLRGVGARH